MESVITDTYSQIISPKNNLLYGMEIPIEIKKDDHTKAMLLNANQNVRVFFLRDLRHLTCFNLYCNGLSI